MQCLQVEAGAGTHTIKAIAVICGKDVSICCGGGDTFHIGASALALPRPSMNNPDLVSASASVLCVTGHKEDEIARLAALRLASKLNTKVNVTCGLHINNAAKHDIELLYQNYLSVIDKLEKKLEEYFEVISCE